MAKSVPGVLMLHDDLRISSLQMLFLVDKLDPDFVLVQCTAI